MNKNDYTNMALHFYHASAVTTSGGSLNITTAFSPTSFMSAEDTKGYVEMTKRRKAYSSGMVQGWNKFCFTGGILEIRAKLPGRYDVGGLWPGMWMMGNLARATYVASSDWIWPWSYDECDRALQRKVTRSMRDLTNRGVERDATRDGMRTDAAARGSKDGDARRGDDDDDANGATRPRDGRTSEARDAINGSRATVGRERGMGRETMTWMEDAVARAVREAERAEREGGRTMRARAASTVAAVMRSGVKNSNGGRRELSLIHI